MGVVGVEVGVVFLGEGVELLLDFGLGGGGCEAEGFVVVWEFVMESGSCGEG